MGGRHESGIHIVRLSFVKVVYSKSFTEKGWHREALYTRWLISPQQLKSWCRFSCPWLTGRNWTAGSGETDQGQTGSLHLRDAACVCVCAHARVLGCQVKCLSHSAGCGENRSWMVSVWQTEPVLLSSPPIRPASLQPGCSWSLSQGPALLGGCAVCVITGPVKPGPADLLVSETLREQNSPPGRRENWGPGSFEKLANLSCSQSMPFSFSLQLAYGCLWGLGFLLVVFFVCSTAGSSPARNQTCAPGVLITGLHWTAWEVPWFLFLI